MTGHIFPYRSKNNRKRNYADFAHIWGRLRGGGGRHLEKESQQIGPCGGIENVRAEKPLSYLRKGNK